jgi:hypothetical protein
LTYNKKLTSYRKILPKPKSKTNYIWRVRMRHLFIYFFDKGAWLYFSLTRNSKIKSR